MDTQQKQLKRFEKLGIWANGIGTLPLRTASELKSRMGKQNYRGQVFTLILCMILSVVQTYQWDHFISLSSSIAHERKLLATKSSLFKSSRAIKNRPSTVYRNNFERENGNEDSMNRDLQCPSFDGDKISWVNEQYDDSLIERARIWNSNKKLLSIGDAGLTTKHINSVLHLARSHNYVKVKLSSHRLNPMQLAESFLSMDCEESKSLCELVDLYEIRPRAILFRRKVLFPEKTRIK